MEINANAQTDESSYSYDDFKKQALLLLAENIEKIPR